MKNFCFLTGNNEQIMPRVHDRDGDHHGGTVQGENGSNH